MNQIACPETARVTRAVSLGADEALAAHVAACPACAAAWASIEELRLLGRSLPYRVPDAERREQLRASLLARAAQREERAPARWGGWRVAAAASVAVLLGGGGLWLLRRPVPGTEPGGRVAAVARDSVGHGVVRPDGQARYALLSGPPDEVIRLNEGTILVEVSPLRRGERFRVLAGDSQIEVRGTLFEAYAAKDHLLRVRVIQGQVEVRAGEAPAVAVAAGKEWQAPAAPVPPAPPVDSAQRSEAPFIEPPAQAPPAGSAPPAAHQHSAALQADLHRLRPPHATRRLDSAAGPEPAPAPGTTPAELAFDDGFSALRAGRYEAAAALFARAAAVGAGGTIAEDAGFFCPVAWARAGKADKATAGLRVFLRTYPNSTRAGEAWSILGWLLYDAHDLDEAERCFQRAVRDRDVEVRQSARAGLGAVSAGRGKRD